MVKALSTSLIIFIRSSLLVKTVENSEENSDENSEEICMVTITGEELIGDVVAEHPKAAGVMLKYGLHCVGCHVNKYESVAQGAKGHGMPDEMVEKMIAEINEVVNKVIETIEVTEKAAEMIKQFAAEDGKAGQGLKIKVMEGCCGFGYEMEFVEKPAAKDKKFDFFGVQVFIDPASYKLLKGSEIDFMETPLESGFRIDNPNAPKGGCACSGEGEEGEEDSGEKEGGCCGGHEHEGHKHDHDEPKHKH